MKAVENKLSIVTGIIKSNLLHDNRSRLSLLSSVIKSLNSDVSLLLLPAGFLEYDKFNESNLRTVEDKIVKQIPPNYKDLTVCFGIDANSGKDQLGIAISSKGITAIGRKFYPASGEDNLKKAISAHEKEKGFDRIFSIKGHSFYIAVCYDSFGIKNLKPDKKETSVILNLIHKFHPKGEGGSGDVDFARKGLACASKQWDCPIFASTTFVHRPVQQIKWPSGVLWNKGDMPSTQWKYDDNPLKPISEKYLEFKDESIALREFIISI